jgi:hypothetical protein
VISYWLRDAPPGGATVTVEGNSGEQIARLEGPAEAGLNRVLWNMRAGSGGGGGGRGGFGGGRGGGPPLDPGSYRITVEVGGEQQSTIGRIRKRIW